MGKIGFANVVSDLYAVGASEIDKIKMIISAPTEFSPEERDIVLPLIIKGFRDAAREAECSVQVGSIAENPWCMVGGIATSVATAEELVFPINATPGDVLILTKPIGVQLATNIYIWMQENSAEWQKLSAQISRTEAQEIYLQAIDSMAFLNKTGAALMKKYGAHAATDVTGFGLLGHAQNLAKFQANAVNFIIHTLPIIRHVQKIATILGREKKLLAGSAVETSGGLLMAIPEQNANEFIVEFEKITGKSAWIIGRVEKGGEKVARMVENPKILEV